MSDTPKGLRQLKNLAECENERLQGVLNAEQKELRELKEYLHVVVDEDGEHYRDWVADCQRLEAALAAAQTELAAEREAKRKALLVWLDALEKEREQRERAERVEAELAQSRQWLDGNTTFYDVDHSVCIEESENVPVLASVSKRIWYHATDDVESYPFSKVIDCALAPPAQGATESAPAQPESGRTDGLGEWTAQQGGEESPHVQVADPLAQSRQAALPYVVEYRRKDQAHQWIPMAAFDQQTVAEKYAAPPQSGDWPWEYRVAEAATQPAQDGMVLVPRDILARVLTAHGCSTVDWDAMRELQKLWIPLATAPDTKPTDGRKKP